MIQDLTGFSLQRISLSPSSPRSRPPAKGRIVHDSHEEIPHIGAEKGGSLIQKVIQRIGDGPLRLAGLEPAAYGCAGLVNQW